MLDRKGLEDPEQDLGDVRQALETFRSFARAAAERPEFFWNQQRAAIAQRLNEPASLGRPRMALAWSSVGLAVLLCLFFFVQPSKAPPPDLPAGADQVLLIEVERALSRECPEALMPAALLEHETEGARKIK